ncbi:MAG: FAD-binding protein [Pseudomonadales bacterium]
MSEEVDVIVVGSGAGALTAACCAHDFGLKVIVLEKASAYGGTSASSGGGLWIPDNHLMKKKGLEDSRDEAIEYLRQLTESDVDQSLIEAFVDYGPQMLEYMEANTHVANESMEYYADYYQELAGSKPGGRSTDPMPYHAKHLGEHFLTMGQSHIQTTVMGLMGYSNLEGAVLLSKSPGWFKVVCKLAFEYLADVPGRVKSRRSRRLVMGNALIGRLRHSLIDRDVEVRLDCPVSELCFNDGRVYGVRYRDTQINARKGVVIAAGGFEHSTALREQYLPRPTASQWSAAYPYNTGDLIVAAEKIGAKLHLMDEAWWGPTIKLMAEDRARMLFTERSMPGCIMINQSGDRFVNESVAYTTAVQAMYQQQENGQNIPAYAVFDARYRREYPFGPLLPKGMRMDWLQPSAVRNSFLTQANNLADLAHQLNVNAQALAATVNRFNGFAKNGKDEDFQRGENSYDLLYGDARIQPNPCLAPLTEPPYYAVEIHPGDIGTKGGLLTNAYAQVLDQQHREIPGLYAIGNSAASPMGRYYPGAGATLGPAMTFGYIAAQKLSED